MKKIIAAVLLSVMVLTLFSCGAKPELVEMNSAKISTITFTAITGVDIDKDTFVDAYNKAEVISKADEDDKKSSEVIVVAFAGGDDHFTLYYLEDNAFAVTGSVVDEEYIIEAPALAEYYNEIAHPTAEFVAIDTDKVATACLTVNTSAEVDAKAFAEAYNKAEFIGAASTEKGNEVILLIYEMNEALFEITYLGEDQFRVSGTLVEVDFIIESADLAKLYTEALK